MQRIKELEKRRAHRHLTKKELRELDSLSIERQMQSIDLSNIQTLKKTLLIKKVQGYATKSDIIRLNYILTLS